MPPLVETMKIFCQRRGIPSTKAASPAHRLFVASLALMEKKHGVSRVPGSYHDLWTINVTNKQTNRWKHTPYTHTSVVFARC